MGNTSLNVSHSGNVSLYGNQFTTADFVASILIILINLFGVTINCLMFRAVSTFPFLHQSSSFHLILHCIVVDAINSCVIPTNSIIFLLGPSHCLPADFCQFYALFGLVPAGVGLYANCTLALQRCIAVFFPYPFRYFATPTIIRCFIATPWILSILAHALLSSGVSGFSMLQINGHPTEHCFMHNNVLWDASLMYVASQMHIPLLFIGISYGTLLIATARHMRRAKVTMSNRVRYDMWRRRFDISRGLFVAFLWHTVGVYQLIYSSGVLSDLMKHSSKVRAFLRVLASSYSALNPIFLCISSKLFRSAMKNIWLCRRPVRIRRRGMVVGPQPQSTV